MFKKGDRVIYVGRHKINSPEYIDRTGTVIESSPNYVALNFDDDGSRWSTYEENIQLIETKPIKLTNRQKMEMAKLKRDIRAAVIEYVDSITRNQEEQFKPEVIKLSAEAEKLKECLSVAGCKNLAPAFSIVMGEKISFALEARIWKKWCMLNSTMNNKSAVGLIYTDGSNNFYTNEGVQTASFNQDLKTSCYATKEQIEEFFEFTPDNVIMLIFKDIPAK